MIERNPPSLRELAAVSGCHPETISKIARELSAGLNIKLPEVKQ